MYIYYQQSYEAHDDRAKRSRQARARRIIDRATRARRQRRRRRAYVAAVFQRLITGSEPVAGMGRLEDSVSGSIATRPGTSVPGRVLVRYAVNAAAAAPL